jgi:hypothetical protein
VSPIFRAISMRVEEIGVLRLAGDTEQQGGKPSVSMMMRHRPPPKFRVEGAEEKSHGHPQSDRAIADDR